MESAPATLIPALSADKFRHLLYRAVALPVVVMLCVAALLLRLNFVLQEDLRLVGKTEAALTQSNLCIKYLVDIETGERGYLVTGDPRFLDSYDSGKTSIDPALAQLERMVRDYPLQERRAQQIRQAAAAWQGVAQQNIDLKRTGGDYVASVASLRDKRMMDAIRAQFDLFKQTERSLRWWRDAQARRTSRDFVAFVALAGLFGGIGLALFARGTLIRLARAYRNSIEEQQTILDHLPVGLAIASDPECRFITGNARLYEMLQMDSPGSVSEASGPPDTLSNCTVWQNGDPVPGGQLPMQQAASTGQAVLGMEAEFHRRDGSSLFSLVSAAPLFDESGAVRGVVGCLEDITERKALEDELREREVRLDVAQKAAGFAIWEWDIRRDRMTWYGDARPPVLPPDEPMPPSYLSVDVRVHPDDRAERDAVMARALAGNEDYQHDYRIVWPDGSVHWISSRGSVVDRQDGMPTRMIGVAFDVTARKIAEARALEAQRMESVGKLAGGIAHEFNNLLTLIAGYAEVICDDIPPDSTLQEDLNHIRRSAARAAQLTSQLLSFARKQMVRYESLDLREVIESIQPALKHLLGETVELMVLHAGDLRPARADRGQMEQLLVNLALNARDAMPDGGKFIVETANVVLGPRVTALGREVKPGDYVFIGVTDTGHGMDQRTLDRAFEPFFTTKDVGKGTGLGLATCFGIVGQAGGYIWAYSEPGRGTTVKIYLPVVVDAASRPGKPREESGDIPTGTETILVAEDNEQVRSLAAKCLRDLGYLVLDAPDGGAALNAAAAHSGEIHLLLSDIVMPGTDGSQLAERLVEIRPGVKIIFMSGYASGAARAASHVAADAPFLQKPFTPSALARIVRDVLDGHFDAPESAIRG
jgi:signal transduction histidine kinase/CHASE3 domain sensor protein/ActR/RegA family two-component response regulator